MEGIKAFRKERGLTQAELAKMANIKRSNLARYELGERNPPVVVLSRIAKALDTTMDELVSYGHIDDIKQNIKSQSNIGA